VDRAGRRPREIAAKFAGLADPPLVSRFDALDSASADAARFELEGDTQAAVRRTSTKTNAKNRFNMGVGSEVAGANKTEDSYAGRAMGRALLAVRRADDWLAELVREQVGLSASICGCQVIIDIESQNQ
jgi:hypothetical protein